MPGTHREAPSTREVSNAVTSCFTDTKTEILRQVDDFNARLDQVQQSQDREGFISLINEIKNNKVGYLFFYSLPPIPEASEEPQWDFRLDRQATLDVARFVQDELSSFLRESIREFASIPIDSLESPPARIFGMSDFTNEQKAYAMLVVAEFNETYATPIPEGYEAPGRGSRLPPAVRRGYDEQGIDSGKFRAYVEATAPKYEGRGVEIIYNFSQATSADIDFPSEISVRFPPYLLRSPPVSRTFSDEEAARQ